jgi:hypothetical protein
MMGLLNFSLLWYVNVRGEIDVSSRGEWLKKSVQQGRELLARSRWGSPLFDARSVLSVREHGKRARTPLAAFFNIPMMIQRSGLTEI